jgi:serine/threonine protein kinase
MQALDATRGIAHLHARGVLHGDLRAARILVAASGRAWVAGYATGALRSMRERLAPGARPKPTRWMAPEVMRGVVPDARADVYSLGMALYEVYPYATRPSVRRLIQPRRSSQASSHSPRRRAQSSSRPFIKGCGPSARRPVYSRSRASREPARLRRGTTPSARTDCGSFCPPAGRTTPGVGQPRTPLLASSAASQTGTQAAHEGAASGSARLSHWPATSTRLPARPRQAALACPDRKALRRRLPRRIRATRHARTPPACPLAGAVFRVRPSRGRARRARANRSSRLLRCGPRLRCGRLPHSRRRHPRACPRCHSHRRPRLRRRG